MHPYSRLADTCFWKKAVSNIPWMEVYTDLKVKFKIEQNHRIGTLGSCFAQRISNSLTKNGFNFVDYEPRHPLLNAATAERSGYGVFSARYGNIYTTRQFRQLLDESFGLRPQINKIAPRRDQAVIDLLRPGIQSDGFDSSEAAVADRKYHLSRVNTLFSEIDILIITLGLTEGWIDAAQNIAYGTHPSVSLGRESGENISSFNLDYVECLDDLEYCIELIRRCNPKVRFILTVSPVALVATHQNEHVLSANCYSKSVLRSVAGKLCKAYDFIDYFPSFEIISSAQSFGQFLTDDLRDANTRGIQTAVSIFKSIFLENVNHSQTKEFVTESPTYFQAKELDLYAQCDEIYNNID